MIFSIQPYQSTLESAVVQLWRATGLTRPWNDPVLDIERKVAVDADLFLVGFVDNQIVGTVMGGYDGHRGWVYYLAVHPDWQGNGYGRALMQAMERKLIARGCPKINLQVRTSNQDVIAFYHALGYKADEVISMGKRLISDE